jgi:hypothetical protein
MILFLLLYSLLFLSIGLWIALKALEKRFLPKEFLYIGALAISLAIYYAIFYLYLLQPSFAALVVKLVYLLSLAALIKLVIDFRKSSALFALVRKFFIIPLLATAVVMFAYSTVFFSCVARQPAVAGYGELDNRTFCHTSTLPFDNSLDFIFGGNILRNQDKKQAIDWNMVDRPPLQIAATLPILDQASHSSQLTKYFSYYLFAIFLQLSWVGAFWGAFQVLKINKRFQALAFVALASTGFFYINSVFVWPKLLAASMVFTGILILLGENKQSRYRYLPFSALLISLGVLSHSGVLFTVIPFSIYYLFKIIRLRKINLRYFGVALAIGLLMLAPWYLYKDSVVKSDRLAKWFFAGVTTSADKRGTAETIVDQYKKLSFGEWVHVKETNAKTLVTGGYSPTPGCSLGVRGFIDKCVFKEWRTITFFSTLFAFEFLGLGWFGVIYQFIRGKIDLLDKELTLLIFGGLLLWVIMMFQPGATIVHQGSYATMMLAFLLVVKKLSELPRFLIGSIATLQIVLFYLAWITPYFRLG